jgi:hypothetical protein
MGKLLLSLLRPVLVVAVLHALLFGCETRSRANRARANDNA